MEEKLLSVVIKHAKTAILANIRIMTGQFVLQLQIRDQSGISAAHRRLQLVHSLPFGMCRRCGIPISTGHLQQTIRPFFGYSQIMNQLLSDLHHIQFPTMAFPTGNLFQISRVVNINQSIGCIDIFRQVTAVQDADAVRRYRTAILRARSHGIGNGSTSQNQTVTGQKVGIFTGRQVTVGKMITLLFMIRSVNISSVSPIGMQERLIIGVNHFQAHLFGIRSHAVHQSSISPEIRHKAGRVLNPLALKHRMRQVLVDHNILNHIQQGHTVGTAPQGNGRTDKIHSGHILPHHVVGLVILEYRISFGRVNHLAFPAVTGMITDLDAPVAIHKGGIAIKNPEVRFLAVIECHIVNAITSHRELLPFVQGNRKRVVDWVGRMGYISRRTGFRCET